MSDGSLTSFLINRPRYRQDDLVIIHSLGDGKEYRGKVVGKACENIIDTYIVQLIDVPGDGAYAWTHAVFPETCLRPYVPHSHYPK